MALYLDPLGSRHSGLAAAESARDLENCYIERTSANIDMSRCLTSDLQTLPLGSEGPEARRRRGQAWRQGQTSTRQSPTIACKPLCHVSAHSSAGLKKACTSPDTQVCGGTREP